MVQTERMWVQKSMDMSDIIANPNHNKARQNISFYLHNIINWKAPESTMNCYSNCNKTKINKNNVHILWDVLRLLKWLHVVTAIFITDLSPFDASPLPKLFMIIVSRARRSATIAWATILEPYHLVTSLQAVWN